MLDTDGSWNERDELFNRPNTSVDRIGRLKAGSVANALAAVIERSTGQRVDIGFDARQRVTEAHPPRPDRRRSDNPHRMRRNVDE